jgi:hypothetical protein
VEYIAQVHLPLDLHRQQSLQGKLVDLVVVEEVVIIVLRDLVMVGQEILHQHRHHKEILEVMLLLPEVVLSVDLAAAVEVLEALELRDQIQLLEDMVVWELKF